MSSFKETLEQKTKEAEEIIKAYLPKEEGSQKTVMEAINYSVKVAVSYTHLTLPTILRV